MRYQPSPRSLSFERLESRIVLSITVNSLLDEADGSIVDGDISLRDAISAASEGETIDFSVQGTIPLTLGFLRIDQSLTIEGPGAESLTIDASPMDPTPTANNGDGNQIFYINDQQQFSASTIIISGLTLTGGDAFNEGGAIESHESLHLIDSIVTGNAARDGGGVFAATNFYGETRIINSSITNNESRDSGGGIWIETLESTSGLIADSTIANNTAADYGGGIGAVSNDTFSFPAELTITNSLVVDNVAMMGGGGIYSTNGSADVLIENSTIADNSAEMSGGGILSSHLSSANVLVNQSTISGNTTNGTGGGIRFLTQSTNPANVRFSTIVNNVGDADASGYGSSGGIRTAGPTVVEHSIVAGNSEGDGSVSDIGGTFSMAFALVGDASTGDVTDLGGSLLGTAGNQIDPLLGPLTDSGGKQVHTLLTGSPAINAGDPQAMAGSNDVPEFDQRGVGFDRVSAGRIDLGSFEVQLELPDADFNDDGLYDCSDINMLTAAIADGSNSADFDLNGDGFTDLDDRDQWLADAAAANGIGGPYLVGDATLDGIVDALDFIAWNDHKFTFNDEWCSGDFNADGIVDGLDYIAWNDNKFTSSSSRPRELNHRIRSREDSVHAGSLTPSLPPVVLVSPWADHHAVRRYQMTSLADNRDRSSPQNVTEHESLGSHILGNAQERFVQS